MPTSLLMPDSVKECLIGEHFAPAQQIAVQIYDVVEPLGGDITEDWKIKGIFCNQVRYQGPLGGLGIEIKPGVIAGLVNLKALPGYSPLMPGAYRALKAVKSSTQTDDRALYLWSLLIGFALERDRSITLNEADDIWLEDALKGYHCRYVAELDDRAGFGAE